MTRESVLFLAVIWTIFGCGLLIELRLKRLGTKAANVADDLQRLEVLQGQPPAVGSRRRERWEQISFVAVGAVGGGGIVSAVVGTFWLWVLEALVANLAMYWFVFVVRMQVRATTPCPLRVSGAAYTEPGTFLRPT